MNLHPTRRVKCWGDRWVCQTKKATYAVTFFAFGKLPGRDLNLGPWGYERNSAVTPAEITNKNLA